MPVCKVTVHLPCRLAVQNVDSANELTKSGCGLDWGKNHFGEIFLEAACNCIIVDMVLRPLHDRVMVTRLDEGEQVRGGIIIPDTAKEKPQQAEVKAVGNGKLLENGERAALDVKPGDRILFGKYGGSEITVNGEEYLILREDEILGVLE